MAARPFQNLQREKTLHPRRVVNTTFGFYLRLRNFFKPDLADSHRPRGNECVKMTDKPCHFLTVMRALRRSPAVAENRIFQVEKRHRPRHPASPSDLPGDLARWLQSRKRMGAIQGPAGGRSLTGDESTKPIILGKEGARCLRVGNHSKRCGRK